jgi:hypothetical protein
MGYLAPKSLSHTLYHTYTHKHTHLHTHTNTNSSTHKHPHLQPLFLVVRFPQTFNLIEVHRTNEKKTNKKETKIQTNDKGNGYDRSKQSTYWDQYQRELPKKEDKKIEILLATTFPRAQKS